ncbi:hypothetical protein FKP32DRAFT_1670722 [Trametes sanguinea]|nr:hypothetical protein FKP32DRAFT_1670722 [Trametes sanguinea]
MDSDADRSPENNEQPCYGCASETSGGPALDAGYEGSDILRAAVLPSTTKDILDIFNCRISVSHQPWRHDSGSVINNIELRALYAKAILWYIDQQCLNVGDGASLVLVTSEMAPDGAAAHGPAIYLSSLRRFAAGLETSPEEDADFGQFMGRSGPYFGGDTPNVPLWLAMAAVAALLLHFLLCIL